MSNKNITRPPFYRDRSSKLEATNSRVLSSSAIAGIILVVLQLVILFKLFNIL